MLRGQLLSGGDLGTVEDFRAESTLLFLLHGYNVNRDRGRRSLVRLEKGLGLSAEVGGWGVVGTLWPGDHGIGGLSYSFEGQDADDTARNLSAFIKSEVRAATCVSFVGHSLGCRVVLETLRRLCAGSSRPVQRVCLLGAAVDADSLARAGLYRRAVAGAERVAVLASKGDRTLRLAYPAGDLLQAVVFWKDDFGFALGYRGPRRHRGSEVPGTVWAQRIPRRARFRHGDYVPSGSCEVKGNGAGQRKLGATLEFVRNFLKFEDVRFELGKPGGF